MNAEKHSQMQLLQSRFEALYPRLLKQKVKESGANGQMMTSVNSASRQIQQALIAKSISLTQRLAVIHTIAKSEVETCDPALFSAIRSTLDTTLGKAAFEDADYFLLCLHNLAALRMGDQAAAVHVVVSLIRHTKQFVEESMVWASEDSEKFVGDVELTLCEDPKLSVQLEAINFMLKKGVLKHDTPDSQFARVFIGEATRDLQDFVARQKEDKFWKLTKFAPYTVWFEPLNQLFQWLLAKNTTASLQNASSVHELLRVTFEVLQIYKENSKYYVVTIGSTIQKQNDSQTGEQSAFQPSVRRMSKLFAEMLNILVQFLSVYLKSLPQNGDAQQFYEILVRDHSGFMLSERLQILNELNALFLKVPSIVADDKYWQVVREGLADTDQACRKLALNVLKGNLQAWGDGGKAFELLWQTFFDIYDTLESFGSHLTKSVWPRTELFYEFMQKHSAAYAAGQPMPPLQDMRMWLLVLYHRVASHNNIKIRKYIQKATLKRKYVTPHMREFFFNEFISWLNQCLIFKDVNMFTQFSKNAGSVLAFYQRYFAEESLDVAADLKSFFYGYTRNKSHSQVTMICLKVLSEQQTKAWVTDREITLLCESLDVAFFDQIMSSRYLCYKFILRMLANGIGPTTPIT